LGLILGTVMGLCMAGVLAALAPTVN
jgi:hypothetical protein